MNAAEQWKARNAPLRRNVPPQVRAYLSTPVMTVSPLTAPASPLSQAAWDISSLRLGKPV